VFIQLAVLPLPFLALQLFRLIAEYKDIPCKVAGSVPRGTSPGELILDEHVSPADQRVMSLASAYALVAAGEALTDAGWKPSTEEERHKTGEYSATCIVVENQ